MIREAISHYRIDHKLGSGGMGVVYLAEDTRLRRKVALKVLSADFTRDKDRLRRFEQEALAASALNHPNILTIYDIGEENGIHYIATEFIPGETLRNRLQRSRVSVLEALELSIQVAGALEEARQCGIIHRDIKPENIMLRPDGLVKVLDFGLAKLTEQNAELRDTKAPTLAQIDTKPGTVLGTVSYMSPEQARGQKLDARTDIFSLGVVIYEMLAGRLPFEGKTNSDILVSILTSEPLPLVRFAPDIPPELEWVVGKLLRKSPEERYQSVRELLIDLRQLKQRLEFESELERSITPGLPTRPQSSSGSGGAAAALARQRSKTSGEQPVKPTSSAGYVINEIKQHKLPWGILLVSVVLISLAAGFVLQRFFDSGRGKTAITSMRVVPVTAYAGLKEEPSFSPHGNQVAFVWDGGAGDNFDIYVQLIDAGTPLRLTTSPARENSPAWSPDGRFIAFLRYIGDENGIFIIPSLGGPERKVATLFENPYTTEGYNELAWSPDGKLMAVRSKSSPEEPFSIYLVVVENGEKYRLTSPPDGFFDRSPRFSPDGKRMAFARGASILSVDLYVVPIEGGNPERLTFDNLNMAGHAWSSDGREIIFSSPRAGIPSLWKIPASGGPSEPTNAGGGEYAFDPCISQNNTLAYIYRKTDTNILRIEAAPSSGKAGSKARLIASTRQDAAPDYSPDGKRLAFASDRSGSWEIWVSDSEGKDPVRLTAFRGPHVGTPRWSPDGRSIAFDVRAGGNSDIYVISAEGGQPRRVTSEPSEDNVPSWSRDGRWLYFSSNRTGVFQIWKVPPGGGEAVQVTRTGGFAAQESFDGKFLYYTRRRIFRGSYLKPSEQGIWKLPVEGGQETRVLDLDIAWSAWVIFDKGICFINRTSGQPAVEILDPATGEIKPIATIDEGPPIIGPPGFTISPDGTSILYQRIEKVDVDVMLVEY